MSEMKSINTNGTPIRYIDQGEGEPVLFIHGSISDHRVWNPQREAVSQRLRFIAVDLRYFGEGEWNDDGSQFSMATHLSDLTTLIERLSLAPVNVVGWSYGSSLALALAVERPQMVKRLFLYEPGINTANILEEPKQQAILAEELASFASVAKVVDLEQKVRRFTEWIDNQPFGEFERRIPKDLASILLQNSRTLPLLTNAGPPIPVTGQQLSSIAVPTLIAKGQRTRAVFQLLAHATKCWIPNAKIVEIPNATHIAPWQNALSFNDALLAFFSPTNKCSPTSQ